MPKSLRVEDLADSRDALLLRALDAAGATELRKRLNASANQMAAVAGLLNVRLHLFAHTVPASCCLMLPHAA